MTADQSAAAVAALPRPGPLGRVLTAMVTAFHDDGSVDLEGTARVATWLVDHGNDGAVVSGVGTNATAHSVELAEQAQKLGADGVLVVTPYYNKPTQDGVLAHFRA